MFRSRRILFVENNRSSAALVARLFEVDDYDVIVTSDVGSALALALEHHPQAIVLDLESTAFFSSESLAALRQDATLRDVPVIAISDASRGAVSGANAVIRAPLAHDSLLELLHCVHGYVGDPEPASTSSATSGATSGTG